MAEETKEETVRIEGIEMPIGEVPQPDEDTVQTEAAFVVYKTSNGRWMASGELLGKTLMVGRDTTVTDYRHAAHDIIDDIAVQETAERTVFIQQQVMAELAKRQRDAAVAAQVAAEMGGGPIAGAAGGVVDLSALKK